MNNLILTGRVFFAIAIIGLGATHFIFLDFTTGRAPSWPDSFPGKLIWSYLTGIFFILVGISVIVREKTRVMLFSAAVLIFVWALLRHIPFLMESSITSSEWSHAWKALWLITGSLAVSATYPNISNSSNRQIIKFMNYRNLFIIAAAVCLGSFMFRNGIQHFMFAEGIATLIPSWFPGDTVKWTYFGGISLVAGGLGLFIPKTMYWASLMSGIMIFSWFWIIHIPRTFTSVSDGIAVFEALGAAGILFVISGFFFEQNQPDQ